MSAIKKIKKPDWPHWLRRKTASLAEGILLVNNVCPNTYTMAANAGLGGAIDESKWELLDASYNWIESNECDWLKGGVPFIKNSNQIQIDLSKFFKWVREDISWDDVPEEIIKKSSAINNKNVGSDELMPWEQRDPNDPDPLYSWYTPARYFARELIKEDGGLLNNRNRLCTKITQKLKVVKIYKRGGKESSFNPDTIKKALSNIKL